jgi:hypothetical protein
MMVRDEASSGSALLAVLGHPESRVSRGALVPPACLDEKAAEALRKCAKATGKSGEAQPRPWGKGVLASGRSCRKPATPRPALRRKGVMDPSLERDQPMVCFQDARRACGEPEKEGKAGSGGLGPRH